MASINRQFSKNDALTLPIFGRKTLSTVPVVYLINLNVFFILYVKEIEIAIWDAELDLVLVFNQGYPRGYLWGSRGSIILCGS